MSLCQITGRESRLRLPGAAIAMLLSFAAPAGAAEMASPWSELPETRARLIAATTGVGAEEVVTVGVQIELAAGWKTYWRSPGDAGSPPHLDWAGSDNLATADVRWPTPTRFTAFGLETFGYADEVILPLRIRLARPGQPLMLRLGLDYQVCKDVCIPAHAELALALPAGPARASHHAAPLARFEAAVPRQSGDGGITIENARVRTYDGKPALEVAVTSQAALSAPDLIVESAEPVYFGKPETSLSADRRKALIRLPISSAEAPGKLIGSELLLTLIDGASACEARIIAAGPG